MQEKDNHQNNEEDQLDLRLDDESASSEVQKSPSIQEGDLSDQVKGGLGESIEENIGGILAEMSFLEHIEELRWTLLRSLAALILGCVFVGFFLFKIVDILEWPLYMALGSDAKSVLAARSPFAPFSTMFQVLFLGGFALALPAILYFVAQFIAPGLTPKEKKLLLPGCVAGGLLFLVGGAFSYFLLVPTTVKFSLGLTKAFGFVALWSPETYFGMLVWMVIGVGLSFEFPLVLLLLVYIGILTHSQLVQFRPYSIVVFLFVAAMVTPTTDPFTFLLMAAPMMILYELSIRLSKIVEGKRESYQAIA